MLNFLNTNFPVSRILKILGWTILFLTNWKIALGFLCILVGEKIENNLREFAYLNIINNILSSLKSLIKKDDITEKIKNN